MFQDPLLPADGPLFMQTTSALSERSLTVAIGGATGPLAKENFCSLQGCSVLKPPHTP